LKQVLALGIENIEREKWTITPWTPELQDKLDGYRSTWKLGSMTKFFGCEGVLEVLDSVFAECLLDETGRFLFPNQNETQRRLTWKRYITRLCEQVWIFFDSNKKVRRPVEFLENRITGVLLWSPTEASPPAPFFGPAFLHATYLWSQDHREGVREVCNHVY
jgi:hypothetical protein